MDSECGGTKMVRIAVVDDRPDDRRRMARITETYFRKKRIPFEVEGFGGSAGLFRALDEKNCFDFFLQFSNCIQKSFWARRAHWQINIHRNNFINSF